jgi:hypothetical protein
MQVCAQVESYTLEQETISYVQSLDLAYLISEMPTMEVNSLQKYLYEVNGNRGYGIQTQVTKRGDEQGFPHISEP